ncbi:2'-5' RNA ligase [Nonomuraea turkmeniaca]|uniref:2'-5' RNA ligase n=1 Tax=Nonomuraea turkmeniaca TaxID=103838 RepID=A0A5S4FN09_9ACTN|nr:RNA ligase [Nonomuraea turkmeniaca]TMR22072.1 2'-5' RNA ligase [Nonomuraea turkmeniaca]
MPAATVAQLHLSDLIDMTELERALHNRHVRRQRHPRLPLHIYNYTVDVQYDRLWTPVTRTCRGLIADDAGVVVARPFPKFFNMGDPLNGDLDLDAPATVTDKMDGSLGVLYPDAEEGGYAIATRGSFTSPQALHATRVWRERYAGRVAVDPAVTYLFEIIYPAGRIVINYHGMDDLVLLGGIDTLTGAHIQAEDLDWPGPKVPVFEYATLRQALTAPDRADAEGFVVQVWQDADRPTLVKIKQDDYKALHRILTGVTARTAWEYLAVNACRHLVTHRKEWASLLALDPARAEQIVAVGDDWLATLIEGVPDEFHTWLRSVIDALNAHAAAIVANVTAFANLASYVYDGDRKAMVREVLAHEHSGAVFNVIDGADIAAYAWKAVYPDADKPWLTISEDVA